MKKNSIKFFWKNILLEMLPSRALFIHKTRELLICDVHLGKADYFQQNGIPLTNNSDEDNFARIQKIVKIYQPKKVIVLGDLFHSKYSISESLKNKVEILPKILNTEIELILGNHDLGCEIKNLSFLNFKKYENLILSHEPINSDNDDFLNICGHYHPKLYLKGTNDKLSFRCFAMDQKKRILYLPAFGDLTGGYPCRKSFKKWAIVSDKEILKI